MAARFRLRRERGEEGAVHALRAVALARAGAGRRDADVADHHRRRLERHDLPAIGAAGLAQLTGPERRRFDIDHPARHGRGAIGMGHFERRIEDRVVADAAGMDVSLVGEVHQVVDHQPVVALERVESPALALPLLPVVPMEIGHGGGIGEGRIARPDPDQPMPLDDRIAPHRGRGVDRLLRRHMGAAPGGIEHQPMIAAHDLVADQPAHRERQQPMPAGVLERGDGAVGAAVENDVMAADRSGRERAPDLMAPGGRIPGVQGEGLAARHRFPPGPGPHVPASPGLRGNLRPMETLRKRADMAAAATRRRPAGIRAPGGFFEQMLPENRNPC